MAFAEYPFLAGRRRDSELVPARHADPTVVWLRGEHDISTASALSETLNRAIALDCDVVADLSAVAFMDAATVSVILRTRESLHRRSRSLTVRSPSRCARRLLELCGLGDLIGPTGAEAAQTAGAAAGPVAWVPALGTDRPDLRSEASTTQLAVSDSMSVDAVAGLGEPSSAVAREPADDRLANVLGGGGP
jgi:anti-anti-sigma factor